MGGTSRISREAYVRFCERLGVKFPGPTRRCDSPPLLDFTPRSPNQEKTRDSSRAAATRARMTNYENAGLFCHSRAWLSREESRLFSLCS